MTLPMHAPLSPLRSGVGLVTLMPEGCPHPPYAQPADAQGMHQHVMLRTATLDCLRPLYCHPLMAVHLWHLCLPTMHRLPSAQLHEISIINQCAHKCACMLLLQPHCMHQWECPATVLCIHCGALAISGCAANVDICMCARAYCLLSTFTAQQRRMSCYQS